MNIPAPYKWKDAWCYAPLALLLVFLTGRSTQAYIGDFGNYYYASGFLLQGRWAAWIYDPALFNQAVYNEGQRSFFLNYAPVPPLSALLYIPVALFDALPAKVLWNSLNGGFFLFSLYRLQRYFRIDPLLVLLVPVLFFSPIRQVLFEGQSYFLLLFLLSEGLIRYLQQQKWTAVLLWALAIHLKLSPAFIVLFLLCEKDWKASAKLIVATIALLLVSVPFLGISTWTNYGINILPRLFNGEINNTYAVNYQSMQVLLKTLFVPDAMHNRHAWFNSPASYVRLSALFTVVVYGFTVLCSFTKIKAELKFGLWLIASLLVSGYGNSFSLVLLIIPAACAYPLLRNNKLWLTVAVAFLFTITNLKLSAFGALPVPLQFPRLYLLLALFVVYVILAGPKLKLYYCIVFFAIRLVPLRAGLYEQNYFLKQEEAILVNAFDLKDDSITLHYFDMEGPRQKNIPLPFRVVKTTTAQPQRIVRGREQVSRSYLVNDSIIIYLSDKNRGVGFYTPRYELLKQQ